MNTGAKKAIYAIRKIDYKLRTTVYSRRDPDIVLRILRQKNLSAAFYAQLEEVYQKIAEAALRGRYCILHNV